MPLKVTTSRRGENPINIWDLLIICDMKSQCMSTLSFFFVNNEYFNFYNFLKMKNTIDTNGNLIFIFLLSTNGNSIANDYKIYLKKKLV